MLHMSSIIRQKRETAGGRLVEVIISGRFCVGNCELQIEGTPTDFTPNSHWWPFPGGFSFMMQISCMDFQETNIGKKIVFENSSLVSFAAAIRVVTQCSRSVS